MKRRFPVPSPHPQFTLDGYAQNDAIVRDIALQDPARLAMPGMHLVIRGPHAAKAGALELIDIADHVRHQTGGNRVAPGRDTMLAEIGNLLADGSPRCNRHVQVQTNADHTLERPAVCDQFDQYAATP